VTAARRMSKLRIHRPREIAASFRAQFGENGRIFRAPGRVNLIGEHTDYNDGFVMPAAIDLSCWVGASRRADRKIAVYAENFTERVEAELDALDKWPGKDWARYALGVAWSLEKAGHRLRGCNLYIAGDVPLGAGLSSSAAVEVATAMALLDISEIRLPRKIVALLCQRAENEYVGARCGIMDQYISCHGRTGHALLLDCRTLETREIPLPHDLALVVCNTMVKHEVATNEYNRRRAESEECVRLLRTSLGDMTALRDVSVQQLEFVRSLLPEKIYRRCRHVVRENERVLDVAKALEAIDLQRVSKLLADSHASLRDDYEVSCPELDLLVEIASGQKGVWGARMTGGGFGGCTINLVEQGALESFVHVIEREYQTQTGLRPEIYKLEAAQGAEMVSAE